MLVSLELSTENKKTFVKKKQQKTKRFFKNAEHKLFRRLFFKMGTNFKGFPQKYFKLGLVQYTRKQKSLRRFVIICSYQISKLGAHSLFI